MSFFVVNLNKVISCRKRTALSECFTLLHLKAVSSLWFKENVSFEFFILHPEWLFLMNLLQASFNCVSKALSSCQSFSSLYIHHSALLHFICRYPEFCEKFGPLVLELWLTRPGQSTDAEHAGVSEQKI